MCGICGMVFPDPDRPVMPQSLERMNRAQAHRGPDGEGVETFPGAGFGHCRLAVLDIAGGAQPMFTPDRRCLLCFNGELYNYPEIRKTLEADGIRFRTHCDTEAVLHAMHRWGRDAIQRFAGMFAFSWWDTEARRLLLVRDRLGVKPLSYASLPDGGLVFGSEVSAIRASRLLPDTWNRNALARYLALGHLVGEESAFTGIRRLPPASWLEWSPDTGIRAGEYWNLAERWQQARPTWRNDEEMLEQFAEHLSRAVDQRLLSDVPLGAFLSGGLDSSTVVALMRKSCARVQTFTIGFTQASFDESADARASAAALNTEHTESIQDESAAADALFEIARVLDEPFADTSVLPTYQLCRHGREHLTVALSGDGGDELLAGYVTHQANAYYRYARRLPGWLMNPLRAVALRCPDPTGKVNAVFKLKQFLRAYPHDPCGAHALWRCTGQRPVIQAMLPDAGDAHRDIVEHWRHFYDQVPALPDLQRFLYVDYKTWLPDDILVKADRASMAHGLEVRSPFLDHRLLEWCAAVPANWKRRGRHGKILLKRFAKTILPPALLRRPKSGFNAPVAEWLRTRWRPLCEERFTQPELPQIGLDLQPAARLWQEHSEGKRDHGHFLFSLLMLMLWIESHASAPERDMP